jgi:non-lysosomal glucosylceramidase
MPASSLDRRRFLKLSLGSAAFAAAWGRPSVSFAYGAQGSLYRSIVPASATAAGKGINAAWLASLRVREISEPTFTKAANQLRYIGMPVGGIACGTLYLGGDGKLWLWDVWHRGDESITGLEGIRPRNRYYAHPSGGGNSYNRGCTDGTNYFAPIDVWNPSPPLDENPFPFDQGFVLRTVKNGTTVVKTLDQKGFSNISFRGSYPLARVTYADAACPLTVELCAHPIFIPLNTPDSSLPATVMEYTLTNSGSVAVEATVLGWMQNPVLLDTGLPLGMSRVNQLRTGSGCAFLECRAEGTPSQAGYTVFADFENASYAPWATTGTAFGSGPILISDLPGYQGDVKGVGTRVVNSHASAPGSSIDGKDVPTGTLVSPDFAISRDYIYFLQGGGSNPALERVRLLKASDDSELRLQTGNDTNTMTWRKFDVRDLRAQTVKFSVEDKSTGGWGNIGIDQILFSDNPNPPSSVSDFSGVVDRGTIGIAELGSPTGRISAADNLSTAQPWLTGKSADTGGIGRTLTVAPGTSVTVRFVVAWHFPNLTSRLPGTRREYLNRFADAFAVADYVSTNFTRLADDTRLWVTTWKDSSLPHWMLDRALATSCTLATSNCFLFTNGRFYATEGVNAGPGTCTHVWYYAQTVARLFPDIERGLRQNVDLNPAIALNANGSIKFRGEYNDIWAWDGQCGVVLRCYREHLGSANSSFLNANWANVKKALNFLIAQDGDSNGVSELSQHNTLDADWYGRVPEHIGLYAAALKAGREMATIVGDTAYATTCNTIAIAAMARLAERFVNTPDYGDGYFTQLMVANIGALGHAEGCYIDQVMGDFYTHMVGLERVTDLTQGRAALRSIWWFNYSHNLQTFLSSSALTQGRIYQKPGEAGLLICTFPNDGNRWPDPAANWQGKYFAECMTGFEYQVGAHCLAEGLLDEGLTIIRAVSDRYDPSKRNPFNEVEYSDHYARAMASYGALITASGFRHSGPDGMIAFAPVLNPAAFKSAFTAAEGWGSYQRSQIGQRVTETITLRRGTLRLRKFECSLPADTLGFLAQAKRNGTTVPATFTLAGSILRCTLPADLILGINDIFEVAYSTSALATSTDTDNDGLTDLEETSGINDPATTADPRGKITNSTATDTDSDGTLDGVEARLGTDPLNSSDYFYPLLSMNTTGQSTLTWPSSVGTTFTIQRSSNLSGWSQIATNLVGQSGHTSFTDTSAPANSTQLFYRVHLD